MENVRALRREIVSRGPASGDTGCHPSPILCDTVLYDIVILSYVTTEPQKWARGGAVAPACLHRRCGDDLLPTYAGDLDLD